MEVRVSSYVEDLEGYRRPINRAFLTMVALDDNQKPTPVPTDSSSKMKSSRRSGIMPNGGLSFVNIVPTKPFNS